MAYGREGLELRYALLDDGVPDLLSSSRESVRHTPGWLQSATLMPSAYATLLARGTRGTRGTRAGAASEQLFEFNYVWGLTSVRLLTGGTVRHAAAAEAYCGRHTGTGPKCTDRLPQTLNHQRLPEGFRDPPRPGPLAAAAGWLCATNIVNYSRNPPGSAANSYR